MRLQCSSNRGKNFIVRFDRTASLQRRISKDEIKITRALVLSGFIILVKFKVIYILGSKYYLFLNVLSDFDVCS